MPYKERRVVECSFDTLERFRRIAPRCETTLSSFKGFANLACAMARID